MKSIKANGKLLDISHPLVMGIVNVTPDSFYAESRVNNEKRLVDRVGEILSQGGDIIDIGAYSSRPGANDVSVEEEKKRLEVTLAIIRKEFPQAVISVDTFRSEIARMCVEKYGIAIVNDISGGMSDKNMFKTIGSLNVGYVLMHMLGNPQNMQNDPVYRDVVAEVSLFFSEKIDQLVYEGACDIIIDPGFGFGKTIEHNYSLLGNLEQFKLFEKPLLVGVSRKSMIYKVLSNDPHGALNGTSVLNTVALLKGANILRVHDVREAVECIKLVHKIQS